MHSHNFTTAKSSIRLTAIFKPGRFTSFSNLIGIILFLGILAIISIEAQPPVKHTEGNRDQAMRSNGRVNASTLGMEIDIPLGNYPGRGINIPVTLSYSSKVWRMDLLTTEMFNSGNACYSVYKPVYGDRSAAGWTTSLAVPYIEYTGWDSLYNKLGFPQIDLECFSQNPPPGNENAIIKRISVHLPSGETHELRTDDTALVYPANGAQPRRDGEFFATDGSNIKYVEDSSSGIYQLLMPDGSVYEFAGGALTPLNSSPESPSVRRAIKLKDRNGNFTAYDNLTGNWTDTIGRVLAAPLGLQAPALPTAEGQPQNYNLPGLNGTSITYKFHWKKLKGSNPADSALTNFNQDLKYPGDKYVLNGRIAYRTTDGVLFGSGYDSKVEGGMTRFNPIVLTKIELPNGLAYNFSYDVFGRIEKIRYPSGGEDIFTFEQIPGLSTVESGDVSAKANFGVIQRRLFETPGQGTPYVWSYSAEHVLPAGYKITTISPEQIREERFLHRGADRQAGSVTGTFGYDDALAGFPYEQRTYDKSGYLVGRQITHYTKDQFMITTNTGLVNPTMADWHPRVKHREHYVYDRTGANVLSTEKLDYEDENNLSQNLHSQVLVKRTSQYGFQASGNTASLSEGTPPDPNPTPVPTPVPPTLVRTSESTFLINDPSIPASVRQIYADKNMVGLATSKIIRDAASEVVSRSETRYDEAGFTQAIGRGLPTSSRIWESTSGNWNNPQAYIQTRARFDTYGNPVESIDAKGNSTLTDYDPVHHAFPVRVTTPAPDPNGVNGSSTGLVSETTIDSATGLILSQINANGQITSFEYDPATLRAIKAIPPVGGGITETIYHDQPGNTWIKNRSQKDQSTWEDTISYFDGLGRTKKVEQLHSDGNIVITRKFDSAGRVSEISNPYRIDSSGNPTEYVNWTKQFYDDAGRLIDIELPDGSTINNIYGVLISDLVGTYKQVTDQAGKKRLGLNDALGRMIRVIEDPDGENLKTDYLFDTLGKVRRTQQGNQQRFFMYDSVGRLLYAKQPEQSANAQLSQTDPVTGNAAWATGYEYDSGGNIIRTTDARGISVLGEYDNLNRLISRDYSDATPDAEFYYDGKGLSDVATNAVGKMTKMNNDVSETRYTGFDRLGRLLSHEQVTRGQTYATGYSYDLSGAIVEETYPSGRVISHSYDQNGELESVSGLKPNQTAPRFFLNQVEYNSDGTLKSQRLGNGRWETAHYNERQQITKIGLGYSASDTSLLDLAYNYGDESRNNGSLLQQTINYTGLAEEIRQEYGYDSLNRLKSAAETSGSQLSWKQTFNYDRFGNRTFETGGTTTLSPSEPAKVTNPQIDSNSNRLIVDQDADGQSDYAYDKTGNLVLDAENKRFIYDAENRVRGFLKTDNSSQIPDTEYEYDPSGKRVRKIVNGTETIFVYNATGNLVAEYSDQLPQDPRTSYLTTDHIGSPRVVTDGAGRVVSRHDYTAFGGEISETIGNIGGRDTAHGYGESDEIRQQYTGYERDKESGLDFAQARYYQSMHGRFTSVDPLTASANLRNPQTFNRYSYVLNSPYKFVDPLGLLAQTVTSGGNNSDSGQAEENKKQEQDIPVPPSLLFLASNPLMGGVLEKLNGQEANLEVNFELSSEEVEGRVELATLVYNEAFRQGQRNAQRDLGQTVDPNSIESDDFSRDASSSETSGEAGVTLSTAPSISGTVGSKEGQINTEGGGTTVSSSINSGVAETVSGTTSVSDASQTLINRESSVRRTVTANNGERIPGISMNTSDQINEIVTHAQTLGRFDGKVSYLNSRTDQ